ncbi:hypothetical protein Vretimale_984 [Volvox reticuliferus]|uniref:Uncharacterized protein n=1 Tax=Volvox reticuliferus TaxID=1737510 RepID=A0A8J4G341_9CHLO|nr:hypothetical protein Vretifemale_10509 [Volvox reticuliferus]GIL94906.1 hypothetical protein Vretimale_984 [Volvox reticuliferus]
MFILSTASAATPSCYAVPVSLCLSQSSVPSTPVPQAETEELWHGQPRAGLRPKECHGFADMPSSTRDNGPANKRHRTCEEDPCETFVLASQTADITMAPTVPKPQPYWTAVPPQSCLCVPSLGCTCDLNHPYIYAKAACAAREPPKRPSLLPHRRCHMVEGIVMAVAAEDCTPQPATVGCALDRAITMTLAPHWETESVVPCCLECLAAAQFALHPEQPVLMAPGPLFHLREEEPQQHHQLQKAHLMPVQSDTCQYRTHPRSDFPTDPGRPARPMQQQQLQFPQQPNKLVSQPSEGRPSQEQPRHQQQPGVPWPEYSRTCAPMALRSLDGGQPVICYSSIAETADGAEFIQYYHLPFHQYQLWQRPRWHLPLEHQHLKWQLVPEDAELLQWHGSVPYHYYHHNHHRYHQRRHPRIPFFAPSTPPLDSGAPSECIVLLCRALWMSEGTTARLALHIWNRICGMVRLLVSVRPPAHGHRHGSTATAAADRIYSVAAVWLAAKLEESRREVPLVHTFAAVARTLPSVLVAAELRVLHWCEWAPYKGFLPDDSHLLVNL